ncbi:MAG: hypothetical protein ACJ78Q_10940 [Chloroflexia bacterium]
MFLNSDVHLGPRAGAEHFIDRAAQAGVSVPTITVTLADHSINRECL